jgi:hypothetical protein
MEKDAGTFLSILFGHTQQMVSVTSKTALEIVPPRLCHPALLLDPILIQSKTRLEYIPPSVVDPMMRAKTK